MPGLIISVGAKREHGDEDKELSVRGRERNRRQGQTSTRNYVTRFALFPSPSVSQFLSRLITNGSSQSRPCESHAGIDTRDETRKLSAMSSDEVSSKSCGRELWSRFAVARRNYCRRLDENSNDSRSWLQFRGVDRSFKVQRRRNEFLAGFMQISGPEVIGRVPRKPERF